MYCPLPISKIKELNNSGWLYPFASNISSWFWEGEELIFFDKPYKIQELDNLSWLVVDEEYLKKYGKELKVCEGINAFSVKEGVPVIPGLMKIYVEKLAFNNILEEMRSGDISSKWSEHCRETMIYKEETEIIIWNHNAIRNIAIAQEKVNQKEQDCIRGAKLALLLTNLESYKKDERYWSQFIENLKKLREDKDLWKDDCNDILKETKKLLLKATGEKADFAFRKMIKEKIAANELNGQENKILSFLKSFLTTKEETGNDTDEALASYMHTLLNKCLQEKYFRQVNEGLSNWMAAQNESNPWTLFAQLQKQPYKIEMYAALNTYAKQQARMEFSSLLLEGLRIESYWNTDTSVFAQCVLKVLTTDQHYSNGLELLKNGLSIRHRKEIVEKIINECESKNIQEEIVFEIYDIQKELQSSFLKFNIDYPKYTNEINSFLAFLMSPLDEDRISEQCAAWDNVDEKLAYVFHSALLGYKNLAGKRFIPFWDAIVQNENFGKKTANFIFEATTKVNIFSEDDIYQPNLFTTQEGKNESVISENDKGQILSILESAQNKGLTLKALLKDKTLRLSKEELTIILDELVNDKLVIKPKKSNMAWHYKFDN